jgi:hypothetical protein
MPPPPPRPRPSLNLPALPHLVPRRPRPSPSSKSTYHPPAPGGHLAYELFTVEGGTGAAVPAGAAATQPETPTATILLAHGLLGQGKNWRSFGRALASAAAAGAGPGVRVAVATVDLRCHGASAFAVSGGGGGGDVTPLFPPPHTLRAAAADLAATGAALPAGPPSILVGHSLGGKVCLEALKALAAAGGRGAPGAPRAGSLGHSLSSPPLVPAWEDAAGRSPSGGRGGGSGSAAHHPAWLPQQVWVLDSPLSSAAGSAAAKAAGGTPPPATANTTTPARWPGGSAGAVLAAVAALPLPAPSRAAATAALAAAPGVDPATAAWLASQLVPASARGRPSAAAAAAARAAAGAQKRDPPTPGLVWGFDAAGAAALLASYTSTDCWATAASPPPCVAVHVVRAAHSDRWSRAEGDRLAAAGGGGGGGGGGDGAPASRAGRLTAHLLPDAGHWLHVDNFDGLLAMMAGPCSAAARVVRDRAAAVRQGGRG